MLCVTHARFLHTSSPDFLATSLPVMFFLGPLTNQPNYLPLPRSPCTYHVKTLLPPHRVDNSCAIRRPSLTNIIFLLHHPFSVSADLNVLPRGVIQTHISKGLESLLTMPFSGHSYCTCPFIVKTGLEAPRNTQMAIPSSNHILPCPHCAATAIPAPSN